MRQTGPAIHMPSILDFVQQSHNFITVVVKLPQAARRNTGTVRLGRTPLNG
jgi:hypothetical protein